MDAELIVASSPHLRADDDINSIMWRVALALAPAAGMSIYFFGARAIPIYVLSIAAAEAMELICLKMQGRPAAHALDGSAFVTGLLLAMVLPPGVAPYVPVVGAVFAIGIAKHAFGGLGHNIWNPALAARVFLQFAYPAQLSLSTWPPARLLIGGAVDAVTHASPLAKAGAEPALSHADLFLGNGVVGCLGETCKFALLIGGVYLIARNIVDWRIPVFYIGTVFVLSAVLPKGDGAPAWAADPLYHVLSGGLILGAFFMATDMVTTPITRMGRIIFAVGCGLMVVLIRRYGGYPEGVAYSIVLMNTFTPLIDRWVRPRLYGSKTVRPAEDQA